MPLCADLGDRLAPLLNGIGITADVRGDAWGLQAKAENILLLCVRYFFVAATPQASAPFLQFVVP